MFAISVAKPRDVTPRDVFSSTTTESICFFPRGKRLQKHHETIYAIAIISCRNADEASFYALIKLLICWGVSALEVRRLKAFLPTTRNIYPNIDKGIGGVNQGARATPTSSKVFKKHDPWDPRPFFINFLLDRTSNPCREKIPKGRQYFRRFVVPP